MIGMRAMQHEEGREFLREARAARIAQADKNKFREVMREESALLGLW